jgi:hypothetical protein
LCYSGVNMKSLLNLRYAMKLFCVIILILTMFSPAFAGVTYQQQSDNERILVSINFVDPLIEQSTVLEDALTVSIPGLPNTNNYHQYRLPVQPLIILLPSDKAVKDIVVDCSDARVFGSVGSVEYGGAVIPLSSDLDKGSVAISNDESFEVSAQSERFSSGGIYRLKGYKILHVSLYPVLYSDEEQQFFFTPTMDLQISLQDDSVQSFIRGTSDDAAQVASIVCNPELLSTYTSNEYVQISSGEQYQYVIITSDDFKDADGEYTFQDLVSQKNSKGVNATIVTVEEILSNPDFSVNGLWGDNNPENPFYQTPITTDTNVFDDTQARIRNFIRFAYTNWGTEYVLLAGDADANNPKDNIVPVRGLFADENGLPLTEGGVSYETDDIPSDVYYACLDGNFNYDGDRHFGEAAMFNELDDTIDEADLYAEVSVGRACVDSDTEVSNFVKKSITYDQLFYDDYFQRVLFLGEYLGSQFFTQWGGDYKDAVEYLFPSDYVITKLYHRDGTWDIDTYWDILNNEPPLIINHDGHGSPNSAMGLNCYSVGELINTKYFFIYSHTCLAGAFDNCWPPDTYYSNDCVAEYFTVETEHGAIATIMNARYGLGSQYTLESPSGAYDKSFFTAVFNHSIRQFGPANHYSKQDHIWQIDENGMRWAYYETNLLGDPELSIKKPLPDVAVNVDIQNPVDEGCLYVNDGAPIALSFLQRPFVFGGITLRAEVVTDPNDFTESVSFIVDGDTVFVDDEFPYEWFWDPSSRGAHTITIKADALYDFSGSDMVSVYVLK